MINEKGQNLIFLISQPSSGSTLMQQVLMNHEKIYSIPEPWLLLTPLSVFNTEITKASFNKGIEIGMLKRFFKENFPNNENAYFEIIAKTYSSLYNRLLPDNKTFFLDKTPRYYLILDEIIKTFPEAKIIILHRNPIAVLISIYNILGRERWNMHSTENYIDFVSAIDAINSIKNQKNIYHTNYEDFLNNFNFEIEKILKYLGLSIQKKMEYYNIDQSKQWGDNSGNIKKTNKVTPREPDDWKNKIKNTEQLIQAQEYLEFLGEEKIRQFGYNFHEIKNILNTLNTSNLIQISKPLSIKQSIFGIPQKTELSLIQRLNKFWKK